MAVFVVAESGQGGTGLKKRSVTVAGHRTSISLEGPFWDALAEIARARRLSLNALVSEIDESREGNLSGAIRVFVLDWFRRKD